MQVSAGKSTGTALYLGASNLPKLSPLEQNEKREAGDRDCGKDHLQELWSHIEGQSQPKMSMKVGIQGNKCLCLCNVHFLQSLTKVPVAQIPLEATAKREPY